MLGSFRRFRPDATPTVGVGRTCSSVSWLTLARSPRMARGIAAVLTFLCLAWPTGAAVAGNGGRVVVRGRPGTSEGQLRTHLAAHGASLGGPIPPTPSFTPRARGVSPAAAL